MNRIVSKVFLPRPKRLKEPSAAQLDCCAAPAYSVSLSVSLSQGEAEFFLAMKDPKERSKRARGHRSGGARGRIHERIGWRGMEASK
jgi:hypothetical protein